MRVHWSYRQAFTLIELLVVVAIIALLIGILVPALQGARSQAREVKCRTQLREYARGFYYYFADSREVFPAADYGLTSTDVTLPTWFQLIDQYWLDGLAPDATEDRRRGEEHGLGRCPELRGTRENNNLSWDWAYNWQTLGYGYNRFWLGYNLFGSAGRIGTAQSQFWRPLNTVRQPSETLLVADSLIRTLQLRPGIPSVGHYLGWPHIAHRGTGADTRHGAGSGRVETEYKGRKAYYLDGRANIAWVDGHVTARRSLEINDVVRWRRLWDPAQAEGGW